MLILRPTELHWISEVPSESQDLCAHSPVEVVIHNHVLVKPADGEWTVSAAALFLLRTLSDQHTQANPVCEHLFPCCGFTMLETADQHDVLILGCPNGINFWVTREGEKVQITNADGRQLDVSFAEWRRAVCEFSDIVEDFYAKSEPKKPTTNDDERGFGRFMAEWKRRRHDASSLE